MPVKQTLVECEEEAVRKEGCHHYDADMPVGAVLERQAQALRMFGCQTPQGRRQMLPVRNRGASQSLCEGVWGADNSSRSEDAGRYTLRSRNRAEGQVHLSQGLHAQDTQEECLCVRQASLANPAFANDASEGGEASESDEAA